MSLKEFNRVHTLAAQAIPVNDGLFSGQPGLSLYHFASITCRMIR